jgi:hypothetical protein
MKESPDPQHEQTRAEIEAHVKAFQAKGGQIQVLPIIPASRENREAHSYNRGMRQKPEGEV